MPETRTSRSYDDSIRVRIRSERREKLERIAHEMSEPGDPVTVSDVVRGAIDELLEWTDEMDTDGSLEGEA